MNEIEKALRDAEGNNELDCEISELRPLLLKAANLIESMQAQLSASQRREKAAVEDLENLIDRECACSYCSHLLETGACALDIKYGDGTCSAQWRGPQEAEKGETNA